MLHLTVGVAPADAFHAVPVLAGGEPIGQIEQCELALEAHDRIQFGHPAQRLFTAEAGEVTAHGHVRGEAALAQGIRDLSKLGQVELKNQREPDDQRVGFDDRVHDIVNPVFHINQHHLVAVAPQLCRQIPNAQIALADEADQCNRPVGLACALGQNGGGAR